MTTQRQERAASTTAIARTAIERPTCHFTGRDVRVTIPAFLASFFFELLATIGVAVLMALAFL